MVLKIFSFIVISFVYANYIMHMYKTLVDGNMSQIQLA